MRRCVSRANETALGRVQVHGRRRLQVVHQRSDAEEHGDGGGCNGERCAEQRLDRSVCVGGE